MIKLGRYTIGNKVYVLAEVTNVNADDDTKYKVKTANGRFYISETEDIIHIDPEQDTLTATELYNIMVKFAKMESDQIQYIFNLYNSVFGTEYDFHSIQEILQSELDYDTLMTIYQYYLDTNEIKVGDIVRVIRNGTTNSMYCGVLHVDDNNEDEIIVYTLYDADNDEIYNLSRSDAQIIRWTIGDKSSAPIESLIKDIRDRISAITGGVDRTIDDIPEIIEAARKAAEDEFNQDEADAMKEDLEDKIDQVKQAFRDEISEMRRQIVSTVNETMDTTVKYKYLGTGTFAAGIDYSSADWKTMLIVCKVDDLNYTFEAVLTKAMFENRSTYDIVGGTPTLEYTITATLTGCKCTCNIVSIGVTHPVTIPATNPESDQVVAAPTVSYNKTAKTGTIQVYYR